MVLPGSQQHRKIEQAFNEDQAKHGKKPCDRKEKKVFAGFIRSSPFCCAVDINSRVQECQREKTSANCIKSASRVGEDR